MGNSSIDLRHASPESNKLDKFSSLFSLKNIIKFTFTKFHSSTADLFLSNKPNSFQKTNFIATGLRDHHKLICTFLRSYYESLNQNPLL